MNINMLFLSTFFFVKRRIITVIINEKYENDSILFIY